MFQRVALCLFLAGGLVGLTGCALFKAPIDMMTRMLSAGGRSVGIGADNQAVQPFRVEPGEIEKAREGEMAPPPVAPGDAGKAGRVASR
jgi:hypothetical protein